MIGPLLEPNDRLLQPAIIQHVTRALMAEGLAPREIADIVQSRYAADFNWGDRWISRDARTRAEFDVRSSPVCWWRASIAGSISIAARRRRKRVCPGTPCRCDLRVVRQRLLWTLVP